jgi:regulator of sirC expression with transglutaminase-like and TPR domain
MQQGDHRRALCVVERSPATPRCDEIRAIADITGQLGALDAALDDLQHYLQLSPEAPDASRSRSILRPYASTSNADTEAPMVLAHGPLEPLSS